MKKVLKGIAIVFCFLLFASVVFGVAFGFGKTKDNTHDNDISNNDGTADGDINEPYKNYEELLAIPQSATSIQLGCDLSGATLIVDYDNLVFDDSSLLTFFVETDNRYFIVREGIDDNLNDRVADEYFQTNYPRCFGYCWSFMPSSYSRTVPFSLKANRGILFSYTDFVDDYSGLGIRAYTLPADFGVVVSVLDSVTMNSIYVLNENESD